MYYKPIDYSYKINDRYFGPSGARDFLVMMLFMKNAFNPHFDPKAVDPDRLLQELICQYEASGYLGEPMELMCSTPFGDYKFTIKRRKQMDKVFYDYSSYEERQLIDDILAIYNGTFRNYLHYRNLVKAINDFNEENNRKNSVTIRHIILSEDIYNYIRRKANNAKHNSDYR